MDERAIQFRVGVLVVATLVITVILIALFGEFPKGFQGSKIVYVRFQSAPGVTVNTPVRKSGILVGRVDDVRLEPDGKVLVVTRMENQFTILENEICRISVGNFLGDAMLEFIPSNVEGLSNEPLQDGALLNGMVSQDAISAMTSALEVFDDMATDIKGTLSTIETASADIGQVAKNLNVLVANNQDQFNRILGKAESALGRFDTAMIAVNDVVGDDEISEKLRDALESIPKLVDESRLLIADIRNDSKQMIQNIDDAARMAETNLENIQGFTKALDEKGPQIVGSLESSLLQLQLVAKKINSEEGALGQFIHNPDLYHRLTAAATNIEEITYQLQPVVYDARVITDKLARNPGRIISGAFRKQSSGLK